MNAWVLVLSLVLLALAQSFLLSRFAMKGLHYTRHFSKKTVYAGEKAELVEIIRNDRLLFIPWLRVESRLSRYLHFGKQDNLSVKADMFHKSIFTLRPFQQITRRHTVTLTHRGVYDAGNVALTAGDLLGMALPTVQQHVKAEILVFPRLLPEEELPEMVSKLQGEMIVRRHLLPDPFYINGIRPYRYGDSMRDVHWPATARMNELQVKTHDDTADMRLLVVINSQLSENQWGEIMDYEQDTIEYAISMTASLCVRVLQSGIACGFAANMPSGEDKQCTVLMPSAGQQREDEILSALSRLRIKRVRNFLPFLEDLSVLRGTDILILSAYTSEGMEEKMAQLRRLGNQVTLQLVDREAVRNG